MHLVVAYGFQGADDDAEKLCFTDQLFDAVMCELAVVSCGQPCVIAGDLNVEPTKIPCLLKGISAGLWVDLQGAWARAAGVEPDITCKRFKLCCGLGESWTRDGGTPQGCPLSMVFIVVFFSTLLQALGGLLGCKASAPC